MAIDREAVYGNRCLPERPLRCERVDASRTARAPLAPVKLPVLPG